MKLYSLIMMSLLTMSTVANAKTAETWTGTWATAVEYTGEGDMPARSLSGRSVRQVVRVSLGGTRMRLQLSNVFGSGATEIRSVYVADALDSCDINARTARVLTFNGRRSITLKAGESVMSDVVKYNLKPLQRLSITVCYGNETPEHATSHRGSRTTSYIADGEVKAGRPFQATERVDHWYNIAAIDVDSDAGAVACLGNSITDGRGTTTNAQNRWTDQLATALGGHTGVLNLGIGGNCVLRGGLSQPALLRFDRDILGQRGVRTLIIFEGVNDIGGSNGNSEQVAADLIKAYQDMTDKAHQAGMRVLLGTITPFGGFTSYDTPFHEAARQVVNQWIRTQEIADGIVDFDALVRQPEAPTRLIDAYSDDRLHLTPAGYEAMGKAAAEALAR